MSNSRQYFPALRCVMGEWRYYLTFMKFSDIAKWIKKTTEIHTNEHLSSMIQREIGSRTGAIAKYLETQDERFFNAVVIGVYGGEVNWLPINLSSTANINIDELDEDARNSVGLLMLSGEERLFAIDGQHRVEAIKEAIKGGKVEDDEIAAIFLPHDTSIEGRKRTRRLFSTLNRYAVPVKVSEIIALSEDDGYAIVARRLVEEFNLLSTENANDKGFVSYASSPQIPESDGISITTIITLYQICQIVSSGVSATNYELLKHNRPTEKELKKIYDDQIKYWKLLRKYIYEYKKVFKSGPIEGVVREYRNKDNGGHILFRPRGQILFARVVSHLMNDKDDQLNMEEAIEKLSKIPLYLNEYPWIDTFWDSQRNKVNNKSSIIFLESLMLHCCGKQPKSKDYQGDKLAVAYKLSTGRELR